MSVLSRLEQEQPIIDKNGILDDEIILALEEYLQRPILDDDGRLDDEVVAALEGYTDGPIGGDERFSDLIRSLSGKIQKADPIGDLYNQIRPVVPDILLDCDQVDDVAEEASRYLPVTSVLEDIHLTYRDRTGADPHGVAVEFCQDLDDPLPASLVKPIAA